MREFVIPVVIGHQMAVDVEGHLHALMPEPYLQPLQVHPRLDPCAGSGMAQRVQSIAGSLHRLAIIVQLSGRHGVTDACPHLQRAEHAAQQVGRP